MEHQIEAAASVFIISFCICTLLHTLWLKTSSTHWLSVRYSGVWRVLTGCSTQGLLRLTSRCRLAGTSPGGWARGTSSPSFLKWLAVVGPRSPFPRGLWAGDRSQLPGAVPSSLPRVPLHFSHRPSQWFLLTAESPSPPLTHPGGENSAKAPT